MHTKEEIMGAFELIEGLKSRCIEIANTLALNDEHKESYDPDRDCYFEFEKETLKDGEIIIDCRWEKGGGCGCCAPDTGWANFPIYMLWDEDGFAKFKKEEEEKAEKRRIAREERIKKEEEEDRIRQEKKDRAELYRLQRKFGEK